MAEILPFPPSKRRGFVRRQAQWFLDQRPHSAEANLHHQLQLQRATMLRRGVDPNRVEAECLSLEAAIRTAIGGFGRTGGAR